ncbi:MAG: DUF1653 domain-containing protein [Patulibacter minatonensis]
MSTSGADSFTYVSEDGWPVPGLYRHYKGGMYVLMGVSRHSETEELLVVYRAADDRLWVRPLSMWSELVATPTGGRAERFALVEAA